MTDTPATPPDWLTPDRHRQVLVTIMTSTFSSLAIAWLALEGIDHIGSQPAYHVAGTAMLLQAAMLIGVVTYAFWNTLRAPRRRIVWGSNPLGSFLIGVMGVLMCIIPVTRILQTQIWLSGRMSVAVEGPALQIGGAIAMDLNDRVKELDLAGVRYVQLGKNLGGMIGGAVGAEPVFRKAGLDTVIVDGRCASSCALMALFFPHRLMTPTGALGYHKLRGAAGDNDTADADTARVRAKLADMGYAPDLIDRLFSTVEVHWYSAKEARSLGLITGCWDTVELKEVPCS